MATTPMAPAAISSPARPLPIHAVTRVANSLRPVIRQITALATRPPSSGKPGSRLKAASTRLARPSSATRSPGQPAIRWLASHSTPASPTDVSGPAIAISASPPASTGSLTIRATPPNNSRLISRVATPSARATRAWASSWASTDAKNAQVNAAERATAPNPVTRGAQTSWLSATNIARPRNQDRSKRTGKPSTRPNRSPRPSTRPPTARLPDPGVTAPATNDTGWRHSPGVSFREAMVDALPRVGAGGRGGGGLGDGEVARGLAGQGAADVGGQARRHLLADLDPPGAEVGGQAPGRRRSGRRRLVRGHPLLEHHVAQHQRAGLTVVLGVDPRDRAAVREQRHRVVAVLALGGGHVDLDPVMEVEQALGALARPDQRVERAEQHRRVDGAARHGRAGQQVRRLRPALYLDLLEQP